MAVNIVFKLLLIVLSTVTNCYMATIPGKTSTHLYVVSTTVSSNSSDFPAEEIATDDNRKSLSCTYAPGLVVGDRKRELYCCKRIVGIYRDRWLTSNRHLSRYLETLKQWKCPQFEMECEKRVYAFNDFTKVMYQYFCNYTLFVEQCFTNVNVAIDNPTRQISADSSKDLDIFNSTLNLHNENESSNLIRDWKKLLTNMDVSQMSEEQLLHPCVQVAQYDAEIEHNGSYQEIIDFGIPFCGITWCGFGRDALNSHLINMWSCLQPGCRSGVISIMVIFGILGGAIAIVNIWIIVIIYLNPSLRNSQAVYKLSLAVADLLVGVVVLPLCIENMRRLVWTRWVIPTETRSIEGYYITDDGDLSENTTYVQLYGITSGGFLTKYPRSYQYFAGSVTAISIFVSVYTLAGASFDRLKAIAKPLQYKFNNAYKVSLNACIFFWIIAAIFGILPIFIKDIQYGLTLSMIFATFDLNGFIMYSVLFFIPLIVVWIGNILTFLASKKHSKFRRSLTKRAQKKRQQLEQRLASTLRLMVGIFTASTLPLLITILVTGFVPSLQVHSPEQFSVRDTTISLIVQFISIFLLFANSLWNFFIYNVKNREFQVSLKTMLKKLFNKTRIISCINSTSMCFIETARKSSVVTNSECDRRKSRGITLETKVDSSNSLEETNDSNMGVTTATLCVSTPNLNAQRKFRIPSPVDFIRKFHSNSEAKKQSLQSNKVKLNDKESDLNSNLKLKASFESVADVLSDDDEKEMKTIQDTSI